MEIFKLQIYSVLYIFAPNSTNYHGGEIIAQHRTPLSPDDTADDIARKEHELEMKFFPQDIEKIIRGIDEFTTR